jgi:hypothetical protein
VAIISLEVAADGPTQVLLLSNYKPSKSVYKPRPASVTSVTKSENGSAKEAFEIVSYLFSDVSQKTGYFTHVLDTNLGKCRFCDYT